MLPSFLIIRIVLFFRFNSFCLFVTILAFFSFPAQQGHCRSSKDQLLEIFSCRLKIRSDNVDSKVGLIFEEQENPYFTLIELRQSYDNRQTFQTFSTFINVYVHSIFNLGLITWSVIFYFKQGALTCSTHEWLLNYLWLLISEQFGK